MLGKNPKVDVHWCWQLMLKVINWTHMIGKPTSKESAAKRVGLLSIIDPRGANTTCSSSHCNLNYLSAQPYRSWRMPKRDMKIERKLLINSHELCPNWLLNHSRSFIAFQSQYTVNTKIMEYVQTSIISVSQKRMKFACSRWPDSFTCKSRNACSPDCSVDVHEGPAT